MSSLLGNPVVMSPLLPLHPSAGQDARRIVRHGLADVLIWLGDEPGPRPGEPLHCIAGVDAGRVVFMVSREMYDRLRTEAA